MSDYVDVLVTKYKMDESDYVRGSKRVEMSSADVAKKLDSMQGPMSRFKNAQKDLMFARRFGDRSHVFDAMLNMKDAQRALDEAETRLLPPIQRFKRRIVTHLTKFDGVGSFSSAFGGALRGIGSMFSTLLRTGVVAAGVATGIGLIGFNAMQAAASFDTMERTFGGALGDMQKGVQMMAAIEKYATKSAFSLDALASASAKLAAGGLSVKTYLPVLERFALIISGVDPQGLDQVAGALMRAKGGAFGEAMESLRRAGVGSSDFRRQGIQVSKAGEIKTTPEEFLRAIIKISEGRIKQIADSISGGAENTIANVGDVLGQGWRAIGDELNAHFLPMLKDGTQTLSELVESGVVKDIAQQFTDLLDSFTGGDGLADAIREIAFEFTVLPAEIEFLTARIKDIANLFIDLATKFGVLGLIDNVIERITGDKPIEGWIKGGGGLGDGLREIREGERKVFDMREDKRKRDAERNGKSDLDFPENDEKTEEVISVLDSIEKNTRDTAESLRPEVGRRILGGGVLGGFGLTSVELGRGPRRKGRPARSGDPWQRMIDLLREAVMNEIDEFGISDARAGLRV